MYNFNNWVEKTRGLYRYVIAANVAYEIHIRYWDHATDILSAMANLYIVGDWRTHDGKNVTERELLLENAPLSACITKAVEDDAANNNIQPG